MKLSPLFRFIGAASVATLVFAAAPALIAQTPDQLLASGITKSRDGNFDGAIADFSRVIELKPDNASAYLNRGLARSGQRNFDGAIADFSKALQLQPRNSEAALNMGIARSGQGNFEGAVADLSKAVQLKPDNANAYLSRGFTLFLKGDFDSSIADYTKAIELKPDSADAYFHRALVRDAQGNLEGAKSDYTKAIGASTAPDDPNSNYALLFRGLEIKRLDGIVDEQLNIAVNWNDPWAKTIASFLTGKVAEADFLKAAGTDVGDDAGKNREQSQAHYFVGRIHLVNKDNAGARKHFEAALNNMAPADIEVRLARAELDRLGR